VPACQRERGTLARRRPYRRPRQHRFARKAVDVGRHPVLIPGHARRLRLAEQLERRPLIAGSPFNTGQAGELERQAEGRTGGAVPRKALAYSRRAFDRSTVFGSARLQDDAERPP
jgi:hypothetical protein